MQQFQFSLGYMDINEIKEIMDIASKLEASFRHIKYLCAKYEELEKGGNSYEPYNNYPFIPGNYGPSPTYPHQPYYQTLPYNPNYGYQPHQMTPHYPMNTFPVNKIQQTSDTSKANRIPIQQGQTQMISTQQKKQQSNITNNQNKPITSKGVTNDKKQSSNTQTKGCPQSPYHVFLKSKKNQIKNEYPHLEEKQLLEIMMQVWKSFTDKQKKPYELEFKRLKYNFESKGKDQNLLSKPDYSQIAKNLKNDLKK